MRLQNNKKLLITTFGCRLNQAESRVIGEEVVNKLPDTKVIDSYKKADIVIINTCCVTNKAEREVRKEIRKVKRENSNCFLIVTGCWVNNNKRLKDKTLKTKIDLLVANEDKDKIVDLINKEIRLNKQRKIGKTPIYKDKYKQFNKALVKIQDGCNQYCSYCIVPYVRGRSKSQDVDTIIKEVNKKVEQGIKEVILTGVDISDFKLKAKEKKEIKDKSKNQLVKLIKLILLNTKIKKISFGSIGLKVFDDQFVEIYQDRKIKSHLTSHFHIPLQSGCDQTLARMKRNYKTLDFIKTINQLKKRIDSFTLSTDIIVGFPGETEKEFKETLKTLKDIKKKLGKSFTHIHIFRFSLRKGTLADKLSDKWDRVNEAVKRQRAAKIRNLISN